MFTSCITIVLQKVSQYYQAKSQTLVCISYSYLICVGKKSSCLPTVISILSCETFRKLDSYTESNRHPHTHFDRNILTVTSAVKENVFDIGKPGSVPAVSVANKSQRRLGFHSGADISILRLFNALPW
jgi:hypothetical protein